MSSHAQRAASRSFISKYLNKETLKYVFTTHFWGPVSNFGIPIAALYDLKKDEALISGPMTGALVIYSAAFMKFALAVRPTNYLLFGCHALNEAAQLGQGFRYLNYHYFSDNKNKNKLESNTDTASESNTESKPESNTSKPATPTPESEK
ncbi:pyruvate transporter mpc1 [Hanseniaspora vineae]